MSIQKPHILILVDYYLPHRGGIEVCTEQHIHAALQAGYRVSVLTSKHTDRVSDQETIQTPHGTYDVYRTGSGRWSYYWSGRRFLKEFLDHHDVDLIHCHTYAAALLGSWTKNHHHITTLVTVHEVFDRLWYRMKPRWNGWLYRLIERYIIRRRYDHIHVPSDFTQEMLVDHYGVDASSITRVYHDLDESRDPHAIDSTLVHDWQMTLGTDRYKILYYGHAGASKGVQTLLSALEQLLPEYPDMLWVANITASRGRNQLLSDIKKRLPEGSYHIQTGMERARLQALVMASDLVVVPSLSEGFGFVGAEVSALGQKAIISRAGALPEVVSGDIQFFEAGNVEQLLRLIQSSYDHHTPAVVTTAYHPQHNIPDITRLYDLLRA